MQSADHLRRAGCLPGASGEMRDEQEFALCGRAQGVLTMGRASKVAAPAITVVSLSRCTHTSYFRRSLKARLGACRVTPRWVSALCSAPPPRRPTVMDAPTQAPAPADISCGRHNIIYLAAAAADDEGPYQDADCSGRALFRNGARVDLSHLRKAISPRMWEQTHNRMRFGPDGLLQHPTMDRVRGSRMTVFFDVENVCDTPPWTIKLC